MFRLIIALSVLVLIAASPAYAPQIAIARFYEKEVTHTSLGNFKGASESWQGQIVLIKSRKAIGGSTTSCVRVLPDVRNCIATYALPEGVLVAQGIVGSINNYSLTITGGTGAYLGYDGWITVFNPSANSLPRTSQLTFHLLGGK